MSKEKVSTEDVIKPGETAQALPIAAPEEEDRSAPNHNINEKNKMVEKPDREEKTGYRQILRQKEYMKIVIASVINRFGDSIDSIAFIWLVYQVTQSAAWSAFLFGVNRIPTIFLQPFAGAAIEGKNKKLIMIITDIIRGICVGFVATAYLMGFLNQWILLASTLIISSAEAFRGPASAALLPKLLDKKYFSFGLSLSAGVSNAAELIGQAAAGVIIALFHISAAIYIDMATFFLSALIILTLRIKETQLTKGAINVKEYVDNLKGGFIYLKDRALLRNFLLLALFLNAILVPFNSLQAPMVSEVLHTDAGMLSVLGIAISGGMIIGAMLYPYLSRSLQGHIIVKIGGYSIAVFYLGFVAIGHFITSPILLYAAVAFVSFVVGTAIAMMANFENVEFMKNIDPEYMARMASISSAACVAAMPLVSFLVGALAKFTSTAALFLISGILDILICLWLCSRKRFAAEDSKETEGIVNGAEISNSSAG